MTRINTKPRKKNSGRAPWRVAKGFLQWLRGRPCIIDDKDCAGRMESCHVDYVGTKGMGLKVQDSAAVPMCSHHHHLQTVKGWKWFEEKYRIKADEIAAAFWKAWPGRISWERENHQPSNGGRYG